MTRIKGGRFVMGSDKHYREEAPAHPVAVNPFWIDRRPVTDEQFAAFVEQTGYRTVAERPLDPADFPGAPAENLVPGSLVFTMTPGPVDLRCATSVSGGHGRRGRAGTTPRARAARSRLAGSIPSSTSPRRTPKPTRSGQARNCPPRREWELAARGGLDGARFVWGEEPERDGQRLANYWHGDFPWRADDGYGRTSPVGVFPPNGFGLYDMAGNVWEWTSDWYAARHPEPADKPCCVPRNPRGSAIEASYDPAQPQFRVPRRVIKGGSFLCADSYCRRYRPAARRPQPVDTGDEPHRSPLRGPSGTRRRLTRKAFDQRRVVPSTQRSTFHLTVST